MFQPPEYNIRTQAMVLQSRPVLERAIGKLGAAEKLAAKPSGLVIPWRKWLRLPEAAPFSPHDQAIADVEAGLKVLPKRVRE